MKIVLLSTAVLVAFVAVWFFFVVPAERRHHERKLELVRKRIERHQAAEQGQDESTDDVSKDI